MRLILTLSLFCCSLISFSQGNPRYLAKPIMTPKAAKRCGYHRGYFLGAGYGFNNNQVLMKLSSDPTWYAMWSPINIEWRTPYNGNRFINIRIDRKVPLEIDGYPIHIAFGFKRIKLHHFKITEQFFAASRVNFDHGLAITTGLAHQKRETIESGDVSEKGIILTAFKEFNRHLTVNASSTYWFKSWQYGFSLREHFIRKRMYIGAGYEKVKQWWDISFELGVTM